MKLFSAAQIKQADQYTITHEPIAGIQLMERAARRLATRVLKDFAGFTKIILFCGPGNNGGDGLVLARLLHAYMNEVHVFYVADETGYTEEFELNLSRLTACGIQPIPLSEKEFPESVKKLCNTAGYLLADALLGTGLSRPVKDGPFAQCMDMLNASPNPCFAIDIPSGMFADSNRHITEQGRVVEAIRTYTFEQPKRSFLFAENFAYTGYVETVPIGLHGRFKADEPSSEFLITSSGASELKRVNHPFSHKGTYGHALLIGGSSGKAGSISMSAMAAMHSGLGLCTCLIGDEIRDIVQTLVPQAMTVSAGKTDTVEDWPKSTLPYSALGIGPGLGTSAESAKVLKNALAEFSGPIILDADALNILSENKTWHSFLPSNSILTPHPGEFDRLTQKHESGFERWQSQLEFSKKHGCYVILKGAYTSVTTPLGKTFFNTSGNPGMATAGSGDVLTGILAALLAQGYAPVDAAILGVYIHGLAGDFAFAQNGREGLTALEITAHIGTAFDQI